MITALTSWVMAAVFLVLHALTFSPHQLLIDAGSPDLFQPLGGRDAADWLGEQSWCNVGSPGRIGCDGGPFPVKHALITFYRLFGHFYNF